MKEPLLEGRFGRSLLGLFVFGALLPLGLNTFLSSSRLSQILEERGREDLRRQSKSFAQEIQARLRLLEMQLRVAALSPTVDTAGASGTLEEIWIRGERQEQHGCRDGWSPLLGSECLPPVVSNRSPEVSQTLFVTSRAAGPLLLGVSSTGDDIDVWGRVISDYLWWGELGQITLPEGQYLTVVDDSEQILLTTAPDDTLPIFARYRQAMGSVDWSSGDSQFVGHFWTLPLRGFSGQGVLTVLVSQHRSHLLAPIGRFRIFFLLATATSLFSMLLLGMVQLRKRVEPVRDIQNAAKRYSQRDFSSLVQVSTRDELADVAESLNTMAIQLDQQFPVLEAGRDITQLILSTIDEAAVVTSALTRLRAQASCIDALIILELDAESPSRLYTLDQDSRPRVTATAQLENVAGETEQRLRVPVSRAAELPGFAAPFEASLPGHLIAAPIRSQAAQGGIVAGLFDVDAANDDQVSRLEQMASLVGVALLNLRQLRELQDFGHQTLKAIARTVDMKSPWTMGHSERVAVLAREVGGQLGLDSDEQEILWQAGIVHDVGKIGVPEAGPRPSRTTLSRGMGGHAQARELGTPDHRADRESQAGVELRESTSWSASTEAATLKH